MSSDLRRAQAEHFDAHSPFTPAPDTLRTLGFRVSYILKDELISRSLLELCLRPGHRVLDLGCGRGMLLDRLATSFGTVGFGIDVSRVTLERLRSESLHSHRIARSEGENLPFPEGSFDAAFSLDVLEHVETPERVLAEMLRVLRPGGVVVCYAISRKNRLTLNWFLMKALETLGVDHWAWNGHAPDRLVDPERTRAYLEHLGCRIQVYQPFHAFFTVLVDQWMLILYWMATRMRLLGERTHTRGMRPERLLDLVSNLVGGLLKPLSRLDRPWVSRGLSNGFLLAATKPLASSTLPPRP